MRTVDCRGRACPQPVLDTKKALEESGEAEIRIIVDNPASKENVRRFVESQGHQVTVAEENDVFSLSIQRKGAVPHAPAVQEQKTVESGKIVVFLDGDSIGRGSEELGKVLMRSFLHTLERANLGIEKIILLNGAVKLACKGSAVLEELASLAQKGGKILACGTCLEYFGLKSDVTVGRVSNMYEILTSLAEAGKVLKI